jgi:hypothetical protein
MDWLKRCKRDETKAAERRTWKTRCGHYKIEEVNIKYGRSYDSRGQYLGYPIFYRAMVMDDGTWSTVSEHRTRKAALAQLEYHYKNGRTKPRNTKANKSIKLVKAKRQAKRKATN